jgi:hypothetical protein
MTTIGWEYVDANGDEVFVEIPAHWEICGTCHGEGHHCRHLGAITEEDREQGWSYDEWEDYRAGLYDRECGDCRGTGKVKAVDWRTFKRSNPEAWAAYKKDLEEEDLYQSICRMEQMLGC